MDIMQDVMNRAAWPLLINQSARDRVLNIIHYVAEQLRDPQRVFAIANDALLQKDTVQWHSPSVSNGFPGLSLFFLFLSLSLQEEQWMEISHKYFQLALQSTKQFPLSEVGLCNGSTGLAITASLLHQADGRYQKIHQKLNSLVAQQVCEREWRRKTFSFEIFDYDIVNGSRWCSRLSCFD